MTVAMNSTAKTYACKIEKTNNILTVTAPAGEKCIIDLSSTDDASLSSDEQGLLYSIEDEAEAALSIPQMRVLVSIRSKINKVKSAPAMEKAIQQSAQHAAVMVERASFRDSRAVDQVEREVEVLDKIAKSLTGDVWKIDYDISTQVRKIVGDPCSAMWKLGAFPTSESVFCIRDEDLQKPAAQELFDLWRKNGAKFWQIRYHPDDLHVVKEQAVARLDEKCKQVKASITARILKADKDLTDAQAELDANAEATEKDRELAVNTRNNTVRSILRGAWEDLRAVALVAERFEETDSVSEMIEGLRATLKLETQVFNKLMKAKKAAERLYVVEDE